MNTRQRWPGLLHWWWFVLRGMIWRMPLYVIVLFLLQLDFFFLFLSPSFVLGCRELLRLQRLCPSRDYHSTRCAGQVAVTKNNACGVGIACAPLWLRQGWGLYLQLGTERQRSDYECSQISCQESFWRYQQWTTRKRVYICFHKRQWWLLELTWSWHILLVA